MNELYITFHKYVTADIYIVLLRYISIVYIIRKKLQYRISAADIMLRSYNIQDMYTIVYIIRIVYRYPDIC